ncbi:MAG: hypothetical protein H0W36_10615 [Gemmatimonadetes bacterium]|nr:hypothetical protein [Gemmatimonadota bacterium]
MSNNGNGRAWRWFIFSWMFAFLGFPIGGFLAFLLVGSIEGVVSAALGGALAGAVIGAAQWLALRRRLDVTAWWIIATALGLALGNAIGTALIDAGTGIGDLLVTGVTAGIAVGFLQWVLLRKRVRGAGLWPPVVAVSWPVGWTVTWMVGVDVERGYVVFGSTGALVFAAITGAAMWMMLRGSTRAVT